MLQKHLVATTLAAFALSACSGSSSSSQNQPSSSSDVIRLGAASSPKYGAVFDAMERDFRRSGQKFEYTLYPDYPTLVDALLGGEVDIAWNTPLAHARALILTNNGVIGPIARDVDVQYTLHLVVRKDSGINSLQDIIGKTIVLGSLESAESNILPRFYLKQQGIDIDSQCTVSNLDGLVDDQMNALSTATNIQNAILNGSAHVGALGEKNTRAFRNDPNSPLKVLWISPAYTHCIMTCFKNYDRRLLETFKRVLLAETMADPIGNEVLVNEGNDRIWLDSENERDQFRGFDDLVAAIREQGIALRKSSPQPGQKVIRLGTRSSTEAISVFRDVVRYFRRENVANLEVNFYGTSQQLEDALFSGRIDVAWSSSLEHAKALIRSQQNAFALVGRDVDANTSFHVIARKGSGFNGLADLVGKRVVFGSKETAELSVLPKFLLPQAGLAMDSIIPIDLAGRVSTDLKPVDGADFVISAVANSNGDAGLVDSATAQAISNDPSSPVEVIFSSTSFSGRTLSALSGRVSNADLDAIAATFQSMTASDPTGGVILQKLKCSAFVRDNSSGYAVLVNAVNQAGQ